MARPLLKRTLQALANRCGYRIRRKDHEDDPFLQMKTLLRGVAEPIIFDVGAHHGLITRKFRALLPSSTVCAFEPFAESFDHLKAATAMDPRVQAFGFGLSDRDARRPLHVNANTATNSLLPTHGAASRVWGEGLLDTTGVVEAEFRSLDSVVTSMGLTHVDVLKLDVQGAEPLVLAGAAAICERRWIRLIYSEIILQPSYQGQERFDHALAAFYERGFDLFDLYNLSRTSDGRLRQVDALFTRVGD